MSLIVLVVFEYRCIHYISWRFVKIFE